MKFQGKIVKGNHIGNPFGVATANIDISQNQPKIDSGVYFVWAKIASTNKKLRAIIHFGERKTFEESSTLEVHILDFNQNIYGEILEIEILKFWRKVKKFQNADMLFSQIEQDIIQAKKFFIRQNTFQHWEKIDKNEITKLNKKSAQRVIDKTNFKSAQNIFCYASNKKNELDFIEILMNTFPEKNYYFPKITTNREPTNEMQFFKVEKYKDLKEGAFNILEPTGDFPTQISPDLFFIPAVAADQKGHRIGKGKGFYDQFISLHKSSKTLCLLPHFAEVEKIPTQTHDQPIEQIIFIR